MAARRTDRGFTLIELAVALVIIAILLGGILTTQSLISSARTQDTIAIATDLSQAARDFRSKFGALPGDHPQATIQIPGTAANGNGNGDIGAPHDTAEVAAAADHLNRAGMIRAVDPAGRITSRFGIVWVMSAALAADPSSPCGTALNLAGLPPAARNVIVFGALPIEVAAEIDLKHDDGVFNTGRIRASSTYAAPAGAKVACFAMPL